MLLSRSKVRVMALAAVGFATTDAGGLAFQAVGGGGPPEKQSDRSLTKGTPRSDPAWGALASARVETARAILNQDVQRFQNTFDGSMLAEIPVWSRRLMEDRLRLASTRDERLAAVREHRDQMKTLERTAEGYAKTGQGRVSDALKVAYYRLEAEQLLVEAGGDVGQVVRPPLPAAPQTPPLTPQGSPR